MLLSGALHLFLIFGLAGGGGYFTPAQPASRIDVLLAVKAAGDPAGLRIGEAAQLSHHVPKPGVTVPDSPLPAESVRDAGSEWPLVSLTKPPRPITDIDLNSTEISESATAGVLVLQLSVNAMGTVESVSVLSVTLEGGGQLREDWLALVLDRFKNALFFPGEIDGKQVASRFPVTVVVKQE